MTRYAVLLAVALLATGAKKKPPKVKELEQALAGAVVGAPVEALHKALPRLHAHAGSNGSASWDACDHRESVRYVYLEESFLSGRLSSVRMSKVEGVLCSHDGKLLPAVKIGTRTPRGVKLGAAEKDVVKAYGAPAETEEDAATGGKTLIYRRALEAKGESPALRLKLVFELRHLKLNSVLLALEPGG